YPVSAAAFATAAVALPSVRCTAWMPGLVDSLATRSSRPASSTFQCCTSSGDSCSFAMTLSSGTGPFDRAGVVTLARTPVELTTREAGLPSAPPAKLPKLAWFSALSGTSIVGAAVAAKAPSGNAVAASLTAGVAPAQLGGTDNLPTVCALPRAAVAALAPRPPRCPPGEDSPPLSEPRPIPWLQGW